MSRRRSKQNGEDAAGVHAAADGVSREEAVEELDEALDALPADDAAAGGDADDDAADDNPLARIDVSGETSFDSAEFEAEDEEAGDEPDAAEASGEDSDEDSEEEDSD